MFCVLKNIIAENVGIATPIKKLQVVGNIKVDTLKPRASQRNVNISAYKMVDTDAVGYGTWQTNTWLYDRIYRKNAIAN